MKEIPMRLKVTFAFDKVIENTMVFVNLVRINFCCEFLYLLWIYQEEICYAISTKSFHWLEEIIIFNLDIDINDVLLGSHLHIQKTSQLCIKDIQNLVSLKLVVLSIKIICNLRFNDNIPIFVWFRFITIVLVKTWPHHCCFILVFFICINRKLVEHSFSFIFFTYHFSVWNPLRTNDFIVFWIIHRIKPISFFNSLVLILEKNNFHSEHTDLHKTISCRIIKCFKSLSWHRINSLGPWNFIFNYLTVDLIRTHLSPLNVLAYFTLMARF